MKIKKWIREPFVIGGFSGLLLYVCGINVLTWKFWVIMPWIVLSNYLVATREDF